MLSYEEMSHSMDFQQEKSIFISLEDCGVCFFKNFISRSYVTMFFSLQEMFECISEGAGKGRESVAFKNVDNYLEPE